MNLMEELNALGANTKEGMGRVMDDADLYKMMLGMFVDSLEKEPISVEEFDGASLDELCRKVHTLKGTTGNLSLTPLFDAYMEILGLLREGNGAEAKKLYLKMMPVQQAFVECINRGR
ncbi:MAG: Hpt domain-containing protein [Subdoligranulum sp.]|nr:Hpt domain-containing protein [Subdoligranulum sp.]